MASESYSSVLEQSSDEFQQSVQQLASCCSQLITHTIRILPGMEILTTLQEYTRQNNLKAAFVMTAVGSVTKAKLRFAHIPGKKDQSEPIQVLDQHLEIVSLVGTISAGSHLHICLSDCHGGVIGGHVMGDLIVFTTCEVVIGESNQVRMTRPFDPNTGFPELKIESIEQPLKAVGDKYLPCL